MLFLCLKTSIGILLNLKVNLSNINLKFKSIFRDNNKTMIIDKITIRKIIVILFIITPPKVIEFYQ